MKICITGITGMVGNALAKHLRDIGHEVCGLSRREDQSKHIYEWNAEKGTIDLNAFEGVDGIVHLAGDNVSEGKWTDKKKKKIRESRTKGTELLVNSLLGLKEKPKFLISGSAIGYYGDKEEQVFNEQSEPGDDFLAKVCVDWEKMTEPIKKSSIRLITARIGVVISLEGGALKKMLPAFKFGLGGRLGSGKQYMSWVELGELVLMFTFLIESNLDGPFNCVSQKPLSNDEFTKTLSKVIKRPAFFHLPAWLIKIIFGEMGEQLLLSSTRVEPLKFIESKYPFKYRDLKETLEDLL
jgi:uncharacterized protein